MKLQDGIEDDVFENTSISYVVDKSSIVVMIDRVTQFTWRYLNVIRRILSFLEFSQFQSLFRAQISECLYLFECISHGDSKYGFQIS